MHFDIGKRLRLRRLIDPITGCILMVPLDHGYSMGPLKGLANISNTVSQVYNGGASCITVHKGLIRRLADTIPDHKGFMIHVSGSTTLSPNKNYKILTGTVPEVISYGADGISCHINISADEDYLMLEDLAQIVNDSKDFGLPVLAMMYVRDTSGKENNTIDALAHAARLAEELGADIVKVTSPKQGTFDEIIQGVEIPVIVAGGAKQNEFGEFLSNIKECILSGASGVSVGRNIFQADNPSDAMKLIKKTVQEAVQEVGRIEILS